MNDNVEEIFSDEEIDFNIDLLNSLTFGETDFQSNFDFGKALNTFHENFVSETDFSPSKSPSEEISLQSLSLDSQSTNVTESEDVELKLRKYEWVHAIQPLLLFRKQTGYCISHKYFTFKWFNPERFDNETGNIKMAVFASGFMTAEEKQDIFKQHFRTMRSVFQDRDADTYYKKRNKHIFASRTHMESEPFYVISRIEDKAFKLPQRPSAVVFEDTLGCISFTTPYHPRQCLGTADKFITFSSSKMNSARRYKILNLIEWIYDFIESGQMEQTILDNEKSFHMFVNNLSVLLKYICRRCDDGTIYDILRIRKGWNAVKRIICLETKIRKCITIQILFKYLIAISRDPTPKLNSTFDDENLDTFPECSKLASKKALDDETLAHAICRCLAHASQKEIDFFISTIVKSSNMQFLLTECGCVISVTVLCNSRNYFSQTILENIPHMVSLIHAVIVHLRETGTLQASSWTKHLQAICQTLDGYSKILPNMSHEVLKDIWNVAPQN